MSKVPIELRVSRTAVAEVRHSEVNDEIAATGSMVEIMNLKTFNISTLIAPTGSYFELRPYMSESERGEGGEIWCIWCVLFGSALGPTRC